MPSESVTPASYVISWGELTTEPARVAAVTLALALTMGAVVAGPGLSPGLTGDLSAVTDTLFSAEALVDAQGRPTRRFQQIWQNAMQSLVEVVTSQGGSITELQAIYAGINTAQSTAAAAVQQVQATEQTIAIANSRTDPIEGNLSATSDGTITVAGHNRIYGEGTEGEFTVAINGGTIAETFSPGDFVRVYYTDAGHDGGTVEFHGTTGEVVTAGSTLVIGAVPIPQVGEAATTGVPTFPPGYVPDSQYQVAIP